MKLRHRAAGTRGWAATPPWSGQEGRWLPAPTPRTPEQRREVPQGTRAPPATRGRSWPCRPTASWLGPRPGLMVQLGIGTTQVHCAYPSVRHPEGNPVGPERQDSPAPTWVLAPQPGPLMLTGSPSPCRVAPGVGRGGSGTWPGALRPPNPAPKPAWHGDFWCPGGQDC